MNNMPTITKHLLIINILMFAGRYVASLYGIDLDNLLGLHFFLASDFRWYQFFTYMFMHGGLEHLFFNMFAVWMFGRIVENTMGPRRYLFYYLTCGLGAGIIQECVQYISFLSQGLGAYEQVALASTTIEMSEFLNRWTTVGASGAVYGILLAFGMTFPEERIFIIPLPVPIKAKYFVCGYAVIELMSALARSNDGVAHFAHLGGMLFGLLLILYWRNHGGNRGSRNGGYGYYDQHYDRGSGSGGWRQWFAALRRPKKPHTTLRNEGKYTQDMDYRRRQKEREEEIDRILDKVRRNGYNGLTDEEKKRLFDFSQKE
ncbi:MAG: rhomboid family intramembrane serine protease [Bacteroidaceae bacterium]|nr:rhomboid family intramembrane serine protease [Bacteroidaceae bacterium]